MLCLILHLLAPIEYSFFYCLSIFILIIIGFTYFIKKTIKDGNYFHFNILFLLINIIIVFVYPLLLFPQDINILFFQFGFDYKQINKATSLCALFILTYLYGYLVSFYNKSKINIMPLNYINFFKYKNSEKLLKLVLFFIFITVLLFYGTQFNLRYDEVQRNYPILTLFSIFLNILMTVRTYQNQDKIKNSLGMFIKINMFPIILILICSLLFLKLGIRFFFLQIILPTIVLYTIFVRTIKLSKLIVFGIVFVIILYFIGQFRSKGFELSYMNFSEIETKFVLLQDLVVIARNNYLGLEYIEKEGFLYGLSFIPYLFFIIPVLPTIMTQLIISKNPIQTSFAHIIYEFNNIYYAPESETGLGEGFFISLYANLGFLAFIVTFLFGAFVCKVWRNRHNIYSLIIYIVLISHSIFLPRGTILELLRPIFWSIIFSFIIFKIDWNFLSTYKNTNNYKNIFNKYQNKNKFKGS